MSDMVTCEKKHENYLKKLHYFTCNHNINTSNVIRSTADVLQFCANSKLVKHKPYGKLRMLAFCVVLLVMVNNVVEHIT